MCGIVGVFGNVTLKHEAIFKQMLIVDQLRGAHSTGAFSVPRHLVGVKSAKVVGTPDVLIDTKGFEQVMSGVHRAIIGHNRFATQGAVNRNNAHPFEFENLIGVHNGSLKNYTKLEGYAQHPVDSWVLYNHIHEKGLKDALENTDGAMALVWWDKKENELNIYRNSERTLFYGQTSDGVVIVGSEFGMIDWISDRNDVELTELNAVPTNLHLRFKMPMGCAQVPKPITEKLEPRPFQSAVAFLPFQRNNNVSSANSSNTSQTNTSASQTSTAATSKGKTAAINWGMYNKLRDERELYEVVRSGTYCGNSGLVMKNDTYPGINFFMVDTAKTDELYKGDFVMTTLSGFNSQDSEAYYFLAQPGMEVIKTNKPAEEEVEDVDVDTEPKFLLSPSNIKMEPKTWYRLYGHCAYCNGDTEPATCSPTGDKSGFLCADCFGDPVIRDSVNA